MKQDEYKMKPTAFVLTFGILLVVLHLITWQTGPVIRTLTFASTSSEYIVLTSSRLDGYSYWESRCSGKLIAECVDMCENITKRKVQSVKKGIF